MRTPAKSILPLKPDAHFLGRAQPDCEVQPLHIPRGIVLPWLLDSQLWQLKVRTNRTHPKYLAISGGHPYLFGADTLVPGEPAILAEGESDTLLLWQEAGDLVGVATLGGCNRGLSARALRYLLGCPRLLVAYDVDAEGDEGAERLGQVSPRMRRIRPPMGKDVTAFWQAGGGCATGCRSNWRGACRASGRSVVMAIPALEPLADVSASPEVVALPKADLHLHQEVFPRLERIIARRQGREPYAWRAWARQVMDSMPPGPDRLQAIYRPDQTLGVDRSLDADSELFIIRVADILTEVAVDGAMYVEVRFGADRLMALPDFMGLFRAAEGRVRARHPRLCAEAIGYLEVQADAERLHAEEAKLDACLRAARDGLGGIDLLVRPYDATDDPGLWGTAYRWAERAAAAGLGLTIHVGEFATPSIAAALRTPGLRRIGHGTHVADDPHLLDELARSGVTLECSLTCNVVLGSAPSYNDHPIWRFAQHGIPVTLATDLPMHVCTTIGREYAIAAALGFSLDDLLAFTRNAIAASFTTATRRAALLSELHPSGVRGG